MIFRSGPQRAVRESRIALTFPDGVRLTPEQSGEDRCGHRSTHSRRRAERSMSWTKPSCSRVGAWAGDRVMPALSGVCGRDGGRRSAWPVTAECCASAATARSSCDLAPTRGAGSPDSSPAPQTEAIADGDHALSCMRTGQRLRKQFAQWIVRATGLGQRSVRAAQAGVDRGGLRRYARLGGSWRHPVATRRGHKGGIVLLPYFDAYVVGRPSARPAISRQSVRAGLGAIRPGGQLSGSAH